MLVVDTAHGHARLMLDMIARLKADPAFSGVDIIGGKVATREGAQALLFVFPIAFGSAVSVVRVVHVGGVIHGGDVVGTASCLFSACLPVR